MCSVVPGDVNSQRFFRSRALCVQEGNASCDPATAGAPVCEGTSVVIGGFGYNRALPPAGQLTEHPFLKVMNGDIELGGTAQSALAAMSGQFPVKAGQHWLAAGVQFTSFGFIAGKAVVAVGFGHKFSLSVLGVAQFARGDVIEIGDAAGALLARGLAEYDAPDAAKIAGHRSAAHGDLLGYAPRSAMVHRDHLVLL